MVYDLVLSKMCQFFPKCVKVLGFAYRDFFHTILNLCNCEVLTVKELRILHWLIADSKIKWFGWNI